MARGLTDEQIATIWGLKNLPQRDVAARVGCSLGMVSKVLAGVRPGPPAKRVLRSLGATAVAAVDRALASAAELVAADLSDDDAYRNSLAQLDRAGQIAAEAEDASRMVQVAKAIASVTKLRSDARPEPKPDENAAPDMMAAASRARATLHNLIDTSPEEP